MTDSNFDEELVDYLRNRLAEETTSPPSYDEFVARSTEIAIAPARTQETSRGIRSVFAAAAGVMFLAAIAIGRYLLPAPIDPASETVSIPRRVHTLETAPNGEAGPPCWLSFQNGDLDGGCRQGSLTVVEFGNEDGYVDGWNSHASLIDTPDGWDVHTYHQMWELGTAESTRRQGFLHHPGGTTTDLASGSQPIFRDPETLNWDFCRTWNPEITQNAESELEPLVNNNAQCVHISPGTDDPVGPLIIGASNPPDAARLEVIFQPPQDE